MPRLRQRQATLRRRPTPQSTQLIRLHEARHTAITEFLRQTGNLKLAQMLAGHADIGTTANIYAHLDTSDLEAALNEAQR